MKKKPLFVAVSNQKGGVGKSAITALLASYFHYVKGLNVAVIDCDAPQHSLYRMRERDMQSVERHDSYRQLIVNQWERIHKKALSDYRLHGGQGEGGGRRSCSKWGLRHNICRSSGHGQLTGRIQHDSEHGLRAHANNCRQNSYAEQPLILCHRAGIHQKKEGLPVKGYHVLLEPQGPAHQHGSVRRVQQHDAGTRNDGA